MKNGTTDGLGVLRNETLNKNKTYSIGDFKNGVLQGRGIILWFDQEDYIYRIFDGQVNNGIAQGKGKMLDS